MDSEETFRTLAGKKLLIRPIVNAGDIAKGFEEIKDQIDQNSLFDKNGNYLKLPILALDGGGIKGIVPMQSLIELERLIKTSLLSKFSQNKQNLPLISKSKMGTILKFRQERLDNQKQRSEDVNHEDFDILLADFFECCAGTSTGSIIAAFVSTQGHSSQIDFIENVIKDGSKYLQTLAKTTRLETIKTDKSIMQDLQEGMQNKQYDGIFYQQGTIKILHFCYYYGSPLIFSPNPQPNILFLDPKGSIRKNVRSQGLLSVFEPSFKSLETLLSLHKLFQFNRNFLDQYTDEGLKSMFQLIFGNKMLSDKEYFKTSLYIPSFDIQHRRPISFFKLINPVNSKYDHGLVTTAQIYDRIKHPFTIPRQADLPLGTVVLASAAAPTFFPGVTTKIPTGLCKAMEDIILVDGGVVANNPIEQAIAFLSQDQNKSLQDYSILSLGCGYSENQVLSQKLNNLQFVWEVMSDVMQNSSTYVGSFQDLLFSQVLKESYLRIQRVSTSTYNIPHDPTDETIGCRMDDLTKLDKLVWAGQTIAKSYESEMQLLVDNYLIPRAVSRHSSKYL